MLFPRNCAHVPWYSRVANQNDCLQGPALTHQWGERQEATGRTRHDCLGPWQPPRHPVRVSNALCHLKIQRRTADPNPKEIPEAQRNIDGGQGPSVMNCNLSRALLSCTAARFVGKGTQQQSEHPYAAFWAWLVYGNGLGTRSGRHAREGIGVHPWALRVDVPEACKHSIPLSAVSQLFKFARTSIFISRLHTHVLGFAAASVLKANCRAFNNRQPRERLI